MENWREQMEESRARQKEYYEKTLAVLKKDYPELDVKSCHVSFDGWNEMEVTLPESETLIHVRRNYDDKGFTFEGKTDYGYTVEKGKEGLTIVEDTHYITTIEFNSFRAYVHKFWKSSGSRVKHVRYGRDVKESSKGRYIVLDGKRVYESAK